MPYPDPFPVPYAGPVTSGLYPLPKHNIVVLSCMDLRMKDELVSFLDRDNLTNRYDHLITAGAALGVMRHDGKDRKKDLYKFGPQHKDCDEHCKPLVAAPAPGEHTKCSDHCPPWRTTFFDHLDIALRLHHPHDVYIVEHRSCGAYKAFEEGDFPNELTDWDAERDVHTCWAVALRDAIHDWYAEWHPAAKKAKKANDLPKKLGVHAFLMDMRGNVELLLTNAPEYPTPKGSTGAKGGSPKSDLT